MIANFFINTIKKILIYIEMNEPVLVIGMFESGKNLTFRHLHKKISNSSDVIFLESVNNSTVHKIQFTKENNSNTDIYDIDKFSLQLDKLLKKQKITLVVNLSEVDEDNPKILQLILNKRHIYGQKFNFVLIGYINVYNFLIKNSSYDEFLSRKMFKLLPVNGKDYEQMIKRNEKIFNITLTQKQKEIIFNESGGNCGLLKDLIIQIKENPKWTNPVHIDDKLQWRTRRMFEGLSKEQLYILKSIALQKNNNFNNQNDLKILLTFGYINQHSSGYRVFSNLVKEYIHHNNWKEKNIEEQIFTEVESRIFALFSINENKLVLKEDIAQVIWGKSYIENYSENAIDRHISNIRKKIKDNKIDLNITTLRGRGYVAS